MDPFEPLCIPTVKLAGEFAETVLLCQLSYMSREGHDRTRTCDPSKEPFPSPPAKLSVPLPLSQHEHRFFFLFLLRTWLRQSFDEAQARRLFRKFEQQALEVRHGLDPRMGFDEGTGLEFF